MERTFPPTVAVGSDGRVNLYNASGSVDVVADIQGYVSTTAPTTSNAGRFMPVARSRICDTATTSPANPCQGQSLASGQRLDVQVTGVGGVPPTGVRTVVLNVTRNQAAPGHLVVYPAGIPTPGGTNLGASNLNFPAVQVVPNRVVTGVGADGRISIVAYTYGGETPTDVSVDVNGWFGDGSNPVPVGSLFTPTNPARICNTSPSSTPGQCQGKTLGPPGGAGNPLTVQVTGQGGVPLLGVTAVVVNAVAVSPSTAGSMTVHPGDVLLPPAEPDLIWAPGQTVANLVVVRVGLDGTVKLSNSAGTTDAVLDVFGWYS